MTPLWLVVIAAPFESLALWAPGLDAAPFLAELQARLPQMAVTLDARPPEAGYYLSLHDTSEVDALAGGRAGEHPWRLRFTLWDPSGAVALEGELPPLAREAEAARELAVLTEGVVRLRSERLSELISRLRVPVAGPPIVPEPAAPAPAEPAVATDVSFRGGVLLSERRPLAGMLLGVGPARPGRLSLRLEAGTDLPMVRDLGVLEHRYAESSVASLAQVTVAERTRVGLGPVLILAHAAAGRGSLGEARTSAHLGARLGLTYQTSVGTTWPLGVMLRLGADVLLRYPEHTWQGEVVFSRGAVRLDGLLGVFATL